ncbi:hypothetical protein G3576_17655 [Roseomonas stagni]|uniref:Uncharacterized protein n=1 Tax=Falsiroseomonas algicola TaxID=2716930 RepID=A0A6M1LQ06_9PROT|nr:hypothetical protein [Falsiroseomonas algicola]NGM21854.1 hypothetical protein [Falsiroseomonas algicola]
MAVRSGVAPRPKAFPRIMAFGIATALLINGFVRDVSPLLLVGFISAWVWTLVLLVKATQSAAAEGSLSIDGDAGGDSDGGGDGGGGGE